MNKAGRKIENMTYYGKYDSRLSKRLDFLMNFMVSDKINLFVTSLNALLPCNKISVRWSAGKTEMSDPMLADMLPMRLLRTCEKRGQCNRKCELFSSSSKHEQIVETQLKL